LSTLNWLLAGREENAQNAVEGGACLKWNELTREAPSHARTQAFAWQIASCSSVR
jgi:hypothetical protein